MRSTAPCARGSRGADGFTLIEVLVAGVLLLMVSSVAVIYVSSQLAVAGAQGEGADVQQRARAAADVLARDLAMAGAWAGQGGADGSITCCLPVIQPRRIGLRSPDPVGTAREDVLTTLRLDDQAIPSTLNQPLGSDLVVDAGSGCPGGDPWCRLREDDTVMVFTADGRHDFFLLGPPAAGSIPVIPRQTGAPALYLPGALVARVETRTYYFDAEARQLRQYDGHQSDVPVVDDVVAVRFEYWGDVDVPARARVMDGVEGCLWDAGGQPRFGQAMASPGAPLVRMSLGQFRDGPWCGGGDHRFDADLLKIRRVRAVVRVAAASDRARGSSLAFARAGTAHHGLQLVPDVEVVIDVAPRGLNADR